MGQYEKEAQWREGVCNSLEREWDPKRTKEGDRVMILNRRTNRHKEYEE